jgi:phage terminase large subunit GpA-like protein
LNSSIGRCEVPFRAKKPLRRSRPLEALDCRIYARAAAWIVDRMRDQL